jgi:hypothetical protein
MAEAGRCYSSSVEIKDMIPTGTDRLKRAALVGFGPLPVKAATRAEDWGTGQAGSPALDTAERYP